MKNLKKILAAVMAIMMVACLFAGCGSKDKNGETKDTAASCNKVKVIDIELTEEEYAFGVDKDQPELLESVNEIIAEIKKDGTFDEICNRYFGDGTPVPVKSAVEDSSKDQLLVATNAAFEPFEYTKGEDFYGVDMEIAQLIADKLGKELVICNMNFEAVCLSIGQHKADIAMSGLTIKPDREEFVTFTDSYYTASQKIIVPADCTDFDECKTADDVIAILSKLGADTKIGVQAGTTGQLFVEGDEEWEFDGLPATCTPYQNGSLAVQDLINGNISYVIIDSAPADFITAAINAVA